MPSDIMNTPFAISTLTPIASGTIRAVYEHPENSSLLIKIIHPENSARHRENKTAWYKRRQRLRQYTLYLREISEYIAAYAQNQQSAVHSQKIVGLMETDLGLGLVTEAARDRDGNLAPSLGVLIKTGAFDAAAAGALVDFSHWLFDSSIIIADLHAGNIVYAFDETLGDHFVMIDGIGSSNLIPFKSWSKRANLHSKKKKIRKLCRKIARNDAKLAVDILLRIFPRKK